MWIIPPGDRSRDTAHAQWPFQVMVMWSDWVTHNSGIDNHRMLKICMCVGCVEHLIHQTPQGQKVEVQGHKVKWILCTKTSNICRKRHRIVEIYPLIGNLGRRTRWWQKILDRKQNSRYFCVCALKKFIAKTKRKCIPTNELFPYYRKSGSSKQMTRSYFWPKAPK